MKIKEQVILESIDRIKSRLAIIDNILTATPLSDIIKLRQEVYPRLSKMDLLDPIAIELVSKSAKKEKRLFALGKQQEKTPELITEKVNLEAQLCDLKNEMYIINMRR